jgi:WD40 repeat protein
MATVILRRVALFIGGTALVACSGTPAPAPGASATPVNPTSARILKHPGGVFRVAFAPDGSLLASGGMSQTVRIWDTAGGAEKRTLGGGR